MVLAAALVVAPLAAVAIGDQAASAARTAGATGYRILLASDRDGTTRGYSVLPDGSRLTPLLSPGSTLVPWAVSGDGGTIAYGDSRGAIYVSRASGAGLRRLVRRGANAGVGLSRDGKLLAFGTNHGIWTVGTNGRGLRRLTGGEDSNPDWAPDSEAFVYDRDYQDEDGIDHSQVVVQPLHGKRRVLVRGRFDPDTSSGAYVGGSAWAPDGRWIAYFRVEGLWVVRPNGTGRHRIGMGDGYVWSPDGARLAVRHGSSFLVIGLDGRRSRRLRVTGLVGIDDVLWPESRHLVLIGRANLDDPGQIWIVGLDGHGLRRLTSQGHNYLVGWTRLEPVQPAAPPVPPAERVLAADTVATSAPVAALSADGPSVAFITKERKTDCDHVAVWAPADGSIRRFGPLPAPCTLFPDSVDVVELAGSRVAWTIDSGAPCEIALESATFADPAPATLGIFACTPSAYDVHGDRDLLVFENGKGLVRIGSGREACQDEGSTAGVCSTLRTGDHVAPVESVSGGLIAIREPGAVAVLDASGQLVRVFPFDPADVNAARLDGGRLVVWRFGVLQVYDVATGVLELSRPMPAGYRLADVDGGIAVLLGTNTIMLLRLDDGHSLMVTPGQEPTLADLEPPGLYYSYATGDGGGRVVFLPRAELVRQLDRGAR